MGLTKAGQRNVMIDLWKFVYAWFIVFYHFYSGIGDYFHSGYYCVDFFLIAAGVFFFRGLEKDPEAPPQKHIFKRFWRFFPWSFTAFIFAFVVIRVVINGSPVRALITALSKDIWEILLVKMNGMNDNVGLVNSPAWTLSSMFLVEIVMVGLFRYRRAFVHVIVPVSLIVGFGYWCHIDDAASPLWNGFTTFAVVRTWLAYCGAYYCLRLSEYLRDADLNRRGELALTALETLCYAFAIVAVLFVEARYYQWCTILAFFIAIAISLSGHSLWNRALQKASGVTKFLGAFSLSIYLIHRPVTRYFEMLYPDPEVLYTHVAMVVAVILVCSLAHFVLVSGLIRLWEKNRKKIGSWFITPKSEA